LENFVQGLTTANIVLQNKVHALESGQADLSELTQLLGKEQDTLGQLIARSTTGASLPSITQDIRDLQQQMSLLVHAGGSPSQQDLQRLKTQLTLIEARLPSDPFIIGGRTLNSKADVALFIEKEVSGLSFSIFHDVITLLESITDGQTKKSRCHGGNVTS